MQHPKITIFTDGSWKGKIQAGGFAALLTDEYGNYMLVGDGTTQTTISRMELTAILTALTCCYDNCDVTIISDSLYSVNVINNWLKAWIRNDFVKRDGSEVANQDILTALAFQVKRMHKVKACHIKSHTGYNDFQSMGNDLCDYYAQRQAEAAHSSLL